MKEALEWAVSAKVKIEPAEDIVEIDAAIQVFLAESFHPGKSAAIVFGALFRVGQDGIGLCDFLEAFLCSRLLVAVGVIFHREVAESVLDRLLLGILGDAEHLVVITLGRNDRSP